MNILYHITPRRNLDKILTAGIIINAPQCGISTHRDHRGKIFLTDNPEYILLNQAGEHWVINNNPVILKIDVSGLEILEYYTNEWYVSRDITPERILEIKTDMDIKEWIE